MPTPYTSTHGEAPTSANCHKDISWGLNIYLIPWVYPCASKNTHEVWYQKLSQSLWSNNINPYHWSDFLPFTLEVWQGNQWCYDVFECEHIHKLSKFSFGLNGSYLTSKEDNKFHLYYHNLQYLEREIVLIWKMHKCWLQYMMILTTSCFECE